ncbi:MAG: Plug and carboxypeptidase regulatory-like domain-containing protein [Algoriphagus sp.]|jgi:hypothetical protein|nr:Plug and carboxypeptidase regulatory-like domain-containing protein [Algoriphagus sp.]
MTGFKKILLLVVFCCLAGSNFAQTKPLTGLVLDSLNRPIAYANVVAINQSTQKIGAFGISNEEGRFKITLATGSTFLLRVSFVGYRQFEQLVSEWDEEKPLVVRLQASDTELGLVEVVSEMPVTMKGDTLTYKTEAFTTGTERKLEDVLEKLPGFQVDENGGVKVQGKNVDKVLVDGKPFFDGDTKLATKNLPANAVDRVQVLKNFNEIAPIRGMDTNETLALNIELKEGKKNMVFGDLTAGIGPQKRYLAHANTFYYAPKLNLNLIGGSNNVGEQPFTLQDYFRFSGGMSALASRAGSRVQMNGEDLGIPMATRSNANSLETNLAAFNLNYSPSSKWRHTGFVIGSTSNNGLGSSSLRTYLNTGQNNKEELLSSSSVENKSGLAKYAITYTPKEETYLKYSFFGKLSEIQNGNLLNSSFGTFTQNINTLSSRNPYTLQQKLEWYHAPSEEQVFSLEMNWERKFSDPFLDLTSSVKPLVGLYAIPNAESYRLLQNQELHTGTLEGVFNYYFILNPTNHLNWSVGMQQLNQDFVSGLSQMGSSQRFDAFVNDNEFDFQDIYLGMSWKTKWKDWVLSPSANLHRYQWTDVQQGERLVKDRLLVLPAMYTKWNITSNRTLTYRWGAEANFMDVQKLAQGLLLQDYNALFRGNRALDNGIFNTHTLSYTHFDMFSGLMVFGNVNYQRKRNDLVTTTDFIGINRLFSVLNVEPVNKTLNGDVRVDKSFNKMKFELGGNWNAFQTNLFLDDQLTQNEQFSQTYDTKLTSTFFKVLEAKFGYSFTANQYVSGRIDNTFTTHSPKLEIDLDVVKGVKLVADYTYTAYLNQAMGTRSDFDFLNAYLSYQKEKSPWEVKLSVWNIADTRAIRRDSFSESVVSTFSYLVQPRYALLTFKYDL